MFAHLAKPLKCRWCVANVETSRADLCVQKYMANSEDLQRLEGLNPQAIDVPSSCSNKEQLCLKGIMGYLKCIHSLSVR